MKIDLSATLSTTQYEDFKYVLQDTGSISLGAKYTYKELMVHEMIPFKLKAVMEHYIFKEADPETTLESEFYYLEAGTFLYEVFSQLKIKVKVQQQEEVKSLFGKTKLVYKEKLLSLKELTDINLAKKKASGMIIREIVISKLGLMTFSV
ncbi:MAG: hypothetical protein IJ409_07020 [Lachnospiraceae bacterium]|nr:hypothetical protein [Lachnospiraceae bacterium]